MAKVCIQAGHKGKTSGATGAPGERDWTTKIVPLIADNLRSKGIEVYETNAFANEDSKVTNTDWDLFLAVHYDADIYNDRGGFTDYPDKSVDKSWERSKQLATALASHYFSSTGIPERPQRSNANTKFYYMWSALTGLTPCVLIECGVGWRKPEDYTILRNYSLISETIADGVLKGLGLHCGDELVNCELKLQKTENELMDMRASRNKWKEMVGDLEERHAKEIVSKNQQLESIQSSVAELTNTIVQLNETISESAKEKTSLLEDYRALENEKVAITTSFEAQIADLTEKIATLEKKNTTLKEKLSKELKGYTKWELFKELWRR